VRSTATNSCCQRRHVGWGQRRQRRQRAQRQFGERRQAAAGERAVDVAAQVVDDVEEARLVRGERTGRRYADRIGSGGGLGPVLQHGREHFRPPPMLLLVHTLQQHRIAQQLPFETRVDVALVLDQQQHRATFS
jgi:hypothetical protein